MDSDRYLDMPISIIKHNNLSGYGRILITNHESRRKICTIIYVKQFTYRPTLHKEGAKKKKEDEYL